MNRLSEILHSAASQFPDRKALQQIDDQSITYEQLAANVAELAGFLTSNGIRSGERIGILATKSIASVTAILATLEAGCVYIPTDAMAPYTRNAFIFSDAQVGAILISREEATAFSDEFRPAVRSEDVPGLPLTLLRCSWQEAEQSNLPDDLAYLLYTSGSTGKPKGVMISHGNALSFIEWGLETFPLSEQDVFSSIAPLHFDLSIYDLFVGLRSGACIVLLDQKAGKNPMMIASLIEKYRISMLYATPTLLRTILSYGRPERYDHSSLRIVHFAGEVFPVEPLRQLKQHWSDARFYNLYGPTETNVVTWHPIPDEIPEDQLAPYPIGISCSHVECRLWDDGFIEHQPGKEAELVVSGKSVAFGYLNLPERTSNSFFTDETGKRWYRTGDLVRLNDALEFVFVGRRDRMVKRRGYRIELGEIEAALSHHPALREAGALPRSNDSGEIRILAYLSLTPGHEAPNAFQLKEHLQLYIPQYMLPDNFIFLENLPKTSTQKIDYQTLNNRKDD